MLENPEEISRNQMMPAEIIISQIESAETRRKQKKPVENHFDDCGEDDSSLKLEETPLSSAHTSTFLCNPDFEQYATYDEDEEPHLVDGITHTMLYGRTITAGQFPKLSM